MNYSDNCFHTKMSPQSFARDCLSDIPSLYFFSVSLKFGACYITGQWGEFKIKKRMLLYISKYFFVAFVV